MGARSHTMIALVGEQPMPVMVPVFQDPPEVLELLCTTDTLRIGGWIKDSLGLSKDTAGVDARVYPESLDPYDPAQIDRVLSALLEKRAEDTLTVNFTGGTKIMSAVALLRAMRAGAESVYVAKSETDWIIRWIDKSVSRSEVSVRIPPDVQLAAHGQIATKGAAWESRFREAASAIATLAALYPRQRLVGGLARLCLNDAGNRVEVTQALAADRQVARKLAEMGLLRCSERVGGTLEIRISGDEDLRKFLGGRWLEAYAYNACSHGDGGSDLFDFCWPNVEVEDSDTGVRNELDLVVCRNANMAICSCKIGGHVYRTEAKDAVYELDSVAGPAKAGTYCRKALITASRSLPKAALARAQKSRILVTKAEDLPRLASKIAGLVG